MPVLNKEHEEFFRSARFAFYLRTSSERQEREGTVESQLDDIWRYMRDHFPWVRNEDVVIYKDEGWSGTNLERPEMDQLRIDLCDNKWDVLVCYDQDRIARDPYLQLSILEEIEKYGKQLILCTTTAPTAGNEDSLMMFEIRGLLAKYERVRSLGRFRIGKLRKARSQKILLSVAPYGYDLVKRITDPLTDIVTDSHIVINEEEAEVVRMMFHWIADEGMTLRQIVRRLYEMNIKPRRNKEGKWATSTLGSLFRNETYIGIARYQTTQAIEPQKRNRVITGPIKNKKTSRKMRPKEDWIEIPVPAILESPEDLELFARAQQQLVKNAAISPRKRKNEYLIGGVIRCSCGSARTGEGPQKGRYLYYRCGSRNRNYISGSRCGSEGINARIADEAVWQKLCSIITEPEVLRKAYLQHNGNQSNLDRSRIEALGKELSLCTNQFEELKQAFISNKINVHDYASLKEEVEKKEVILRDRLQKLQIITPAKEIIIPESEFGTITAFATNYIQDLSFEQKRGIVVQLVDNIVAVPGLLEITGHIGVSSSAPETYSITQVDYSPNSSNNHVKLKTICRNCGVA
ncbi:MAG: recombinase family protein [Rickettsiales bacterium]